jgi:ABC-2 type transport system permease protein
MISLLKKEINTFFSSITGYLVIIIFLLLNSLFLWIFPGELNILDSGYANLDTLFYIAPWVFLFLIPAITMKSFAEEKKTGTFELLLTRPLSYYEIITAKYFAAVILCIISLIPTIIYYLTVYFLGNPVGNIDNGAFWGSFIGLFLLASIYVSIGIFTSSITDNQVIAFILAIILCFLLYSGFNLISSLFYNVNTQNFILLIGIDEHYKSVSRGVIDSRDVIYFLSVIYLFLFLTKLSIKKS